MSRMSVIDINGRLAAKAKAARPCPATMLVEFVRRCGVRAIAMTLGQKVYRANSGVRGAASSGGAILLTKAEMPVPASGHEPGVVNSTVYAGGRKVADVAIEEAGEWSKRPGHVVWIGLVEQ